MKTVREILNSDIKEYENLIRLLYEIENITEIKMEPVIERLDNLYDFNCGIKNV